MYNYLYLSYHQKGMFMLKISSMDRDLYVLSKYKALCVSKYILMLVLVILSFFIMYRRYSYAPFYILIVLALLPNFVSAMFVNIKDKPNRFHYLKYKLNYSRRKYLSNLVSIYFCNSLFVLWRISFFFHAPKTPWLINLPLLFILLQLGCKLIGQYLYFFLYKYRLLNNKI